MSSEDFRELVLRAQRGDEEAMQDVFARVRPYLVNLARGLDDPARASRSVSDLVQDAEIQAWRGMSQFLGGEDDSESFNKFRAWMQTILRNVARNVHRDRNAEKRKAPGYRVVSLDRGQASDTGQGDRPTPAADDSTASERFATDERTMRVREAIQRIPDPIDRRIVTFYFFEIPNLTEISKKLELPYRETRERYMRCVRDLGRELGGLDL
ncbi:MAG: sigma-70 family RNA polymerase sigma factor [Planctomycetota bacterium]